jgi:hypothetical protein
MKELKKNLFGLLQNREKGFLGVCNFVSKSG